MMKAFTNLSLSTLLAASFFFASGCDKKETPSGEAAARPGAAVASKAISLEVRKEAQEVFEGRCTPCHGPTGKGDGPASAGLTPKPANLGDVAWQKSVTDEHIEKIISYGGAAVGKSAAMPPNPDLADKPVVQGLREHIRSLAR